MTYGIHAIHSLQYPKRGREREQRPVAFGTSATGSVLESMDCIAVLTGGGDAPGMNNAIRGVVRAGLEEGFKVFGVQRGYAGLMEGDVVRLRSDSVGRILEQGGTILRTYRTPAFRREPGQVRAMETLREHGVDGLVVIGGDGTVRGARALDRRWDGGVVGIPATIDNDLAGTEVCLGFDTAVNTALEAVDRIRDTATSHERTFIVEVMGRDSGHLAARVGLAGGAEEILIPEQSFDVDAIAQRIRAGRERGTLHYLVVLAEGAGRGFELARDLEGRIDMETRVAVLGHVQRGGSPSARDRVAGSKMGYFAVEALADGHTGVNVGLHEGNARHVDFETSLQGREIDRTQLDIARTLSS